jgi:pantoate--beta-alanine ligase
MVITGSINKARKVSQKQAKLGRKVGFVPTMGALHKGHISLINRARKECDFVAVSIFVNPAQFGPQEDYRSYPRNFYQDKKLLAQAGVDLLFFPRVDTIYLPGASVFADESDLSRGLCGKWRPGHFRGVCTILVKLFNIIGPDVAYFGRKDYQQALIVRRLVRDFNFPIKIKILPTVRQENKLALSSRNAYLRGQARENSLCLYQALCLGRQLIRNGEKNPQKVIRRMEQLVKSKKSAKIDYIEIVDAENLKKVGRIKGKILIALAVRIKGVRLIDNFILRTER